MTKTEFRPRQWALGIETYKGKTYDATHGSPFDRGMADSFYMRASNPHCYMYSADDTTKRVTLYPSDGPMYTDYLAGYAFNEELCVHKDYGEDVTDYIGEEE